MREIKFRAWDKKNKEMFISAFVVGKYGWIEPTDRMGEQVTYGNHLELMQYTGLKAKGVEIYEGDIVVAAKDKKVVRFSQSLAGWTPFNSAIGDELQPDEVEVIGNIYENSNLLKE